MSLRLSTSASPSSSSSSSSAILEEDVRSVISRKDLAKFESLIAAHPEILQLRSLYGSSWFSLLDLAIQDNAVSIVSSLLNSHHIQVKNLRYELGNEFHRAAISGNLQVFDLLIQAAERQSNSKFHRQKVESPSADDFIRSALNPIVHDAQTEQERTFTSSGTCGCGAICSHPKSFAVKTITRHPLIISAVSGRNRLIIDRVINLGGDVNGDSEIGYACLHQVINSFTSGYHRDNSDFERKTYCSATVSFLQFLIHAGANVNFRTALTKPLHNVYGEQENFGCTPLYLAIKKRAPMEILECLLKNGASVIRDPGNRSITYQKLNFRFDTTSELVTKSMSIMEAAENYNIHLYALLYSYAEKEEEKAASEKGGKVSESEEEAEDVDDFVALTHWSWLHQRAYEGRLDLISSKFSSSPSSSSSSSSSDFSALSAPSAFGTPFQVAARNGQLHVLEWCIQQFPSCIDLVTAELFCRCGDSSVFQFLLAIYFQRESAIIEQEMQSERPRLHLKRTLPPPAGKNGRVRRTIDDIEGQMLNDASKGPPSRFCGLQGVRLMILHSFSLLDMDKLQALLSFPVVEELLRGDPDYIFAAYRTGDIQMLELAFRYTPPQFFFRRDFVAFVLSTRNWLRNVNESGERYDKCPQKQVKNDTEEVICNLRRITDIWRHAMKDELSDVLNDEVSDSDVRDAEAANSSIVWSRRPCKEPSAVLSFKSSEIPEAEKAFLRKCFDEVVNEYSKENFFEDLLHDCTYLGKHTLPFTLFWLNEPLARKFASINITGFTQLLSAKANSDYPLTARPRCPADDSSLQMFQRKMTYFPAMAIAIRNFAPECCICMQYSANVVGHTCKHRVCCSKCAEKMKESRCPQCTLPLHKESDV